MKNAVILGQPAIVYKRFLIPFVISQSVLLGYLYLVYAFIMTEKGLDIFIDHLDKVLLWLIPAFVIALHQIILITRQIRYQKRLKQCAGKACFRCDYDLIDGQTQCPECGCAWEPGKLNRSWKKKLGIL